MFYICHPVNAAEAGAWKVPSFAVEITMAVRQTRSQISEFAVL